MDLKNSIIRTENSITAHPDMAVMESMTAFVEEYLDTNEVPMKLTTRLMVAFDEIYSNIILYSGANTSTVEFEKDGEQLTMTFTDDGKAYDPTEAPEPDTEAGLEEREIGGLGIFMVRKMAKSMEYERKDGKNILTTVFELAKK